MRAEDDAQLSVGRSVCRLVEDAVRSLDPLEGRAVGFIDRSWVAGVWVIGGLGDWRKWGGVR